MKETATSVLYFKGRITFERIGILLNELKNRKNAFDIHPVLYKKLLTLIIEVLENTLKYSDYFEDFTVENPEFQPEFELSRNNRYFILISRNPVRREDQESLSSKIDRINRSNDEELKKIYRETITNGLFTEKGGAGLGLIEMAKIISRKMEYKFQDAGSEYKIFELVLIINHIEE